MTNEARSDLDTAARVLGIAAAATGAAFLAFVRGHLSYAVFLVPLALVPLLLVDFAARVARRNRGIVRGFGGLTWAFHLLAFPLGMPWLFAFGVATRLASVVATRHHWPLAVIAVLTPITWMMFNFTSRLVYRPHDWNWAHPTLLASALLLLTTAAVVQWLAVRADTRRPPAPQPTEEELERAEAEALRRMFRS